MKRCRACEQELPLETFEPRRGVCSPCKRAQARAYAQTPAARERRRLLSRKLYAEARVVIEELKSQPCADCGVTYPSYVMQFDHRNPATKKMAISDMAGSGYIAGILKEAAKCDIVCANCHLMRTHRQRQEGIAKPVGRPLKN